MYWTYKLETAKTCSEYPQVDLKIPGSVAHSIGLRVTSQSTSLVLESTLWKCQKGNARRNLTIDYIFLILQGIFWHYSEQRLLIVMLILWLWWHTVYKVCIRKPLPEKRLSVFRILERCIQVESRMYIHIFPNNIIDLISQLYKPTAN